MTKEVTITKEYARSMDIKVYNEKTLLLIGNTKPHKEELKQMGARFNYGLGGWIYPADKREELEAFLERHTDHQVQQLAFF